MSYYAIYTAIRHRCSRWRHNQPYLVLLFLLRFYWQIPISQVQKWHSQIFHHEYVVSMVPRNLMECGITKLTSSSNRTQIECYYKSLFYTYSIVLFQKISTISDVRSLPIGTTSASMSLPLLMASRLYCLVRFRFTLILLHHALLLIFAVS